MSSGHAVPSHAPGPSAGPDYALPDAALLALCREDRLRARRPGGQHANRNETCVRLTHLGTGLQVLADERRSLRGNRDQALRRLRLRLVCEERGLSDLAWLTPHRQGARLRCGPQAASWPLVAAVLLDALLGAGGRLREAAAICGLSPSQLAKALAADPPVRTVAEAIRAGHGLGRLRI